MRKAHLLDVQKTPERTNQLRPNGEYHDKLRCQTSVRLHSSTRPLYATPASHSTISHLALQHVAGGHFCAIAASLVWQLGAPARGLTAIGGYCACRYNVTEERNRVTLQWGSFRTRSSLVEAGPTPVDPNVSSRVSSQAPRFTYLRQRIVTRATWVMILDRLCLSILRLTSENLIADL